MDLFSLNQTTLPWWVEVSTSVPQQTYHLGPFNSLEEAKVSRGAHVEVLHHMGTRDIVALVKQR
jgi:hypothetical protein